MKKKTKKIIDKYDPIIYPRLLCVCKNITLPDLRKYFELYDGHEIPDEYDPIDNTFTLRVRDKKTYKYVILVSFGFKNNSAAKDVSDIAHEAEHVKQFIFEDIGLCSTIDSQEADAYLVGWAAECMYKTLIKK